MNTKFLCKIFQDNSNIKQLISIRLHDYITHINPILEIKVLSLNFNLKALYCKELLTQ